MKKLDSKILFRLAGILILMGGLASGVFRVVNSSGFGSTVLGLSFSGSSALNTTDEYRFNNHGKIVGINKSVYEKSIGWAHTTLVIQSLLWLPAILIIGYLGIKKSPLSWTGLFFGISGVVIWLIAELSSPI